MVSPTIFEKGVTVTQMLEIKILIVHSETGEAQDCAYELKTVEEAAQQAMEDAGSMVRKHINPQRICSVITGYKVHENVPVYEGEPTPETSSELPGPGK
jgi:hypothetical protein